MWGERGPPQSHPQRWGLEDRAHHWGSLVSGRTPAALREGAPPKSTGPHSGLLPPDPHEEEEDAGAHAPSSIRSLTHSLAQQQQSQAQNGRSPTLHMGVGNEQRASENGSVLDKSVFGEQNQAGEGDGCVEDGEGRGGRSLREREATKQRPWGAGNVDPKGAQCTVGISHHQPGAGTPKETGVADGVKRGGTERASILKIK